MEPGEVLRDKAHAVGVKDAVGEEKWLACGQRLLDPPAVPQMQRTITEVVGHVRAQMSNQRPGADHCQHCIGHYNG